MDKEEKKKVRRMEQIYMGLLLFAAFACIYTLFQVQEKIDECNENWAAQVYGTNNNIGFNFSSFIDNENESDSIGFTFTGTTYTREEMEALRNGN